MKTVQQIIDDLSSLPAIEAYGILRKWAESIIIEATNYNWFECDRTEYRDYWKEINSKL